MTNKILLIIPSLLFLFSFKADETDKLDPFKISKAHIIAYSGMTPEEFKDHITAKEFEHLTDLEGGCVSYWYFCMDCPYDIFFTTCPAEEGYFSFQFSAEKSDSSGLKGLEDLISGFKNDVSADYIDTMYTEDGNKYLQYYFETEEYDYTYYIQETFECEDNQSASCYYVSIEVYTSEHSDEEPEIEE